MTFAVFLVIEPGGGDGAAALLLPLLRLSLLLLLLLPTLLVLQETCIRWTLCAFLLLQRLRYLG